MRDVLNRGNRSPGREVRVKGIGGRRDGRGRLCWGHHGIDVGDSVESGVITWLEVGHRLSHQERTLTFDCKGLLIACAFVAIVPNANQPIQAAPNVSLVGLLVVASLDKDCDPSMFRVR